MDSLDFAVISELMKKGRASWAELAQKVGLSAPGLMDRIRRLEEKKIIRGYKAIIDPEALGLDILAFVSVSLEKPTHRSNFLKRIKSISEIQECHQITGEYDYLLKIRTINSRHLDQIVNQGIKSLAGVTRVYTSVVMGSEKETTELPLPEIEKIQSA